MVSTKLFSLYLKQKCDVSFEYKTSKIDTNLPQKQTDLLPVKFNAPINFCLKLVLHVHLFKVKFKNDARDGNVLILTGNGHADLLFGISKQNKN